MGNDFRHFPGVQRFEHASDNVQVNYMTQIHDNLIPLGAIGGKKIWIPKLAVLKIQKLCLGRGWSDQGLCLPTRGGGHFLMPPHK